MKRRASMAPGTTQSTLRFMRVFLTRSRSASCPLAAVVLGALAIALASAPDANADGAELRARPRWARHFRAEGVVGVAVARVGESGDVLCYGGAACSRRYVPASTFKIANSLIALETGALSGPEHVIPWDGVERSIADWNQDLDLKGAVRVSAVPYFQEVARRVGAARMDSWLDRLGYGNREMGEVIDQFWLEGPLEISPVEQLDFLGRLSRGELPVSERTRTVVLDILELSREGDRVLRGKTGWVRPGEPAELGWFVGFLERPEKPTIYVAVLVTESSPRFGPARRAVAERILRELDR